MVEPPSAAGTSTTGSCSTETVDASRRWARKQLTRSSGNIDPREANALIGLALDWPEAKVLAHGDTVPTDEQVQAIRSLVERRCLGAPFAYLAGHREFYGREFSVDERVLIPRPETEHLVEAVLSLNPVARQILDIGTGSGCIAITLALELPQAVITATDVSIGALRVARANAARLGVDESSLTLAAADLTDGLDIEAFDTVVSNPPYIAQHSQLPATVVNFEPHRALFAGDSGLESYTRLVGTTTPFVSGQRLLLELGAQQRTAVQELAAERFVTEAIVKDLQGWERVLSLCRV